MYRYWRHIYIFFAFILIINPIFAQQEDTSGAEELLRHEWGAGGLLHIDGFGVTARNIRSINYYNKWFYELDIITMKHPKEVKTINSFYPNTKSFIYGKKNSVFIVRGGLGRLKLLNREPLWESGVEVRLIYSVGASLAFTKPVYVYIIQDDPSTFGISRKLEKFDSEKHGIWDIQGRGPFTKGFNELGFFPGAFGKLGFNFEIASERQKVRALEAGAVIDLYPKKIPIMDVEQNKQLFLSFYVSFYFGTRYN
ncbi:MAG: hypothetical protein K9H84_03750 [Bacteroidales bacterium]|nr:hypothetical protein [Bacteroidales bacterium]